MRHRIRWYGPTLVVLFTALLVMVAGPSVVRQLVFAGESAHIELAKNDLAHNQVLEQMSQAYREIAQAVEPSVVHVQVFSSKSPDEGINPEDFFFHPHDPGLDQDGDQPQGPTPRHGPNDNLDKYNPPHPYGTGSGWVYDAAGHIITNYHVIRDADKIVIKHPNGSEQTATVVGYDDKTDVAVLKVAPGDLHPASLGTKPVEQGDIVFAFGSPFQFDFSMSQGIISGKNRQLGILRDTQGYENFLQTDAAINPGNSGGPLVNIRGEVVGMNTAIATHTGTYSGLGFAIPIDMVRDAADQIIEHGKVVRGYLGIIIRPLTPALADSFGFKGEGVLVENPLKGGPAEAAGVQRGDIITKINDRTTTSADDLREYVASLAPGRKVDIHLFRDGKTLTLTTTIGEMPAQIANLIPGRSGPGAMPEEKSRAVLRKLGLDSVVSMSDDVAQRFHITSQPGVLVLGVRPDSAAADAHITRGCIINDVNGVKIESVDQLVSELGKHDLTKGVRLTVVQDDNERFEMLQLPER